MGRRNRVAPVNRFIDGQRQSIGDQYVNQACGALDVAFQTECAMFVQEITISEWIDACIEDDVKLKLKAAHGVAIHPGYVNSYDMDNAGFRNMAVGLDFEYVRMLPPQMLHPRLDQPASWLAIHAKLAEINGLRLKWGAVKHTLRWFNKWATPGAVRNLWPAALALCPNSASLAELKESAPVRYDTPKGYSDMLPLVRYTAGVVGAMQLIPSTAKPRVRNKAWLTLTDGTATVEGVEINLDRIAVFTG